MKIRSIETAPDKTTGQKQGNNFLQGKARAAATKEMRLSDSFLLQLYYNKDEESVK
ncbi:hypothetical protein HMPREF1250_1313 [Megasphaera vaginalis (ex Srinivasan et al. 2021)]|uniref:Uncharacterized protein n=1 Tax=Megasphaera vaginalis (ex Srinivasan et al. 2021) TaxID=1111454 RepID=U7UT10_9FIRM|nr:hypothetical protein HMPREF1250_1313 [Megasphaera vaginalis (ex Srinivasan et al. 2021)]